MTTFGKLIQQSAMLLHCIADNPTRLIFKLILCTFFLISSTFAKDQNDMIILLGTSTSGKTTLVKKIMEHDPNVENCSMDLMYWRKHGDELKERYPTDYDHIAAVVPHDIISNVVYGDDFHLQKQDLPEDLKVLAMESAKRMHDAEKIWDDTYNKTTPKYQQNADSKARFHSILDQIIEKTNDGKRVILDDIRGKIVQDLKGKAPDIKMTVVRVFCSMEELSRRLTLRNDAASIKGESSNLRIGFPLWQYAEIYKKRESLDEPLLETLKRSVAEKAFDAHLSDPYKKEIKGVCSSIAKTLGYDDHTKEAFLSALGFSEGIDDVDITVRNIEHDFMIIDNTETQENPEVLLNHVRRIAEFSGLLPAETIIGANA